MRRQNLPILVEDLSFFERALPVHIDAVIGLDVLGQSAFEIDYTRWQIHFGSFRPLANSLPLRIEAGLPIVDAELNHLAVHLLMDTGASSLLLFEPRTSGPVSPTEDQRRCQGRPVPLARFRANKFGCAACGSAEKSSGANQPF